MIWFRVIKFTYPFLSIANRLILFDLFINRTNSQLKCCMTNEANVIRDFNDPFYSY